jgi:hypothetical protein
MNQASSLYLIIVLNFLAIMSRNREVLYNSSLIILFRFVVMTFILFVIQQRNHIQSSLCITGKDNNHLGKRIKGKRTTT